MRPPVHYIPKGFRGSTLALACEGSGTSTPYPEYVTCGDCLPTAASEAEKAATEAAADKDTARWARLDRIAREVRARWKQS